MRHYSWIICVMTLLFAGLASANFKFVRPSTESKPVEKDGLSITVSLKEAHFGADPQWPQFVVRFTNVSQADLLLLDYDADWDWKILFTRKDKGAKDVGPWLLRFEPFKLRRLVTEKMLKPGEATEVTVDLNQTPRAAGFVPEGTPADSHPSPLAQLRPGIYQMVIQIELQNNHRIPTAKYWTGPVTTNPVDIDVQDAKAIYGAAIARVVKQLEPSGKLTSVGLWTNGLVSGSISLPATAKPQDVIAEAVKRLLPSDKARGYRILDIRKVSSDASADPVTAALIQTAGEVKVLIFFPFHDLHQQWWARFYDATLSPATEPATESDQKPNPD